MSDSTLAIEQIINALDEIRFQSLFIHDAIMPSLCFNLNRYKNRPVYLIETLSVINTLVANGTMLFYGGHGGGKTTFAKLLGRLFLDKSEKEIEEGILRGHPQLTEEKILGTIDIDQLMHPERRKDGRITVIWSEFVKSDWKIIDELNRMSPYAQNIILSLLAEGIAKYYDQTHTCEKFTLFATMNPKDEGSFDLPLPFMDRFSIAVPVTMPDYESQQTIGERDRRIQDARLPQRAILQDNIRNIRKEVDRMKLHESASDLIDMVIEDSRLCRETKKEINQNLHVNNGLCRSCRFHTQAYTCNKFQTPLSMRVRQDLIRYGKALAWYLNDDRVKEKHIRSIAPYTVWHRVIFNKDFLSDRGIYKSDESDNHSKVLHLPLKAAEIIIDEICSKMKKRKPFIDAYRQLNTNPKLYSAEIDKLRRHKDDDLFIGYLYDKIAKRSTGLIENPEEELNQANTVEVVEKLINKFKRSYAMPNQIQWIRKAIEKHERIFFEAAKSDLIEKKLDELIKIIDSLDKEDSLKQNLLNELGDDLGKMKLACDYSFYTSDRDDHIELTMYSPKGQKIIECTIKGSLTSDFYRKLKASESSRR